MHLLKATRTCPSSLLRKMEKKVCDDSAKERKKQSASCELVRTSWLLERPLRQDVYYWFYCSSALGALV